MKRRGPIVLILLILCPVALWLATQPWDMRFANVTTTLTSIGILLALAGASAFALNLVLSARFQVVEQFFGGLDKMFRVHQMNGRAAVLLLLGHAGFIVGGRVATSVDEGIRLFTASGWSVIFGVLALAGMLIAIGLTLYVRLNHEVFVYVQRAFGFIFILALVHIVTGPGMKGSSPAPTYYLVGASVLGLASFAYRSIFDDVLVRRHDYRVTEVRPLDESVMEIVMAPSGDPLSFKPGQFLFVTFYSDALSKELHPVSVEQQGQAAIVTLRPGDIRDQFHPFSITSKSGDRELSVIFKAVGDYTHAMRSLEAGAWARVEGPYGRFSYLDVPNRRQIWIGGGIGITPFLSMARSLGSTHEIDFYYAMRSVRHAYLLAEFLQIAESRPNLRVIPFPEDEFGYLTAAAIEQRSGGLGDKEILICGPPAMIDALRSQLHAKGVRKKKVHFEKFGFAPK